MKFSVAFLLAYMLSSNLVSGIPVPDIETVFLTVYTTVVQTTIGGLVESTTLASILDTCIQATSTANESESTDNTDNEKENKNAESQIHSYVATTTSVGEVSSSATTSSLVTSSPTSTTSTISATQTSEPRSGTFSGQGTFYSTGLGACGKVNQDSDYIVAISQQLYNEHNVNGNSNDNSLCGKKIKAFYSGKSVEVTVVDSCVGCSYNDLDFSPSAFSQLADQNLGRIDITWEWMN